MNTRCSYLYFLTRFRMHYCVFVMTEPGADSTAAVDAALAPFEESLDVEPYRVHFDHREVRRMAAKYGIEPANLHALADKMSDWTGRDGGVDRDGLYYLSTCNPDGYWDWYEIGGRWNGYLPRARDNRIRAGALAASPDLKDCLPYYVLTPEGKWLEQERTYLDRERKTFTTEAFKGDGWLRLVRESLEHWPDHDVVCVDIHS